MPAGAVALSPITDLALTGASVRTRRALDPYFAKADASVFLAAYMGGHDPGEPYLSPLGADLHGLPPMLIHLGDHAVPVRAAFLTKREQLPRRAIGRHFSEWLSSILFIGYIMAAFDEEKRALHDRICGTRVVFR